MLRRMLPVGQKRRGYGKVGDKSSLFQRAYSPMNVKHFARTNCAVARGPAAGCYY